MGTPHKYATVIKAWADGAEIECRAEGSDNIWNPIHGPYWDEFTEYRIKRTPIKSKRYKRVLYYNKTQGAWAACIIEPNIHRCTTDRDFVRFLDTEWQQEEV